MKPLVNQIKTSNACIAFKKMWFVNRLNLRAKTMADYAGATDLPATPNTMLNNGGNLSLSHNPTKEWRSGTVDLYRIIPVKEEI